MKIRAFIALKIQPEPALRTVIRQFNEMGTALKSVDPNQLHLTFKFLGDIEEEMIPRLNSRVEEVIHPFPSFAFQLLQLGTFPNLKRPLVAWAGVDPGSRLKFIELAGLIEDSISDLGFKKESRIFHPHVTLARIKRKPPEAFFELMEEKGMNEWGAYSCDEIHLVKSKLTSAGAIYTNLNSFPFAE